MAGIWGDRDDHLAAFLKGPNTAGPDVILHVARALDAGGIRVALEFREDLRQRLADDVGEHVEPAAVRHPDDDFLDAVGGSPGQQLLQDGDGRLRPFQRKTLLAHETRVQKMLERFGVDEFLQDPDTRVAVERPTVRLRLHAELQPALLLRVLDVHVLAANLPAVGLAQSLEGLSQRGNRPRRVFADGLSQAAGQELPVQVPDRQPIGGRVEFRMIAGLGAQRIEIGDQVAADAIGIDELQYRRLLGDLLDASGHAGHGSRPVRLPAHWPVRRFQVGEDLFVEPILALQQGLHLGQKQAGFRALYDAVVVGAGDHHDLPDAQHGRHFGRRASVLGGIVDGAGGDDGALARHQARNGAHSPDRAGVGQGDCGALEVLHRETSGAGAGDQFVIGRQELLEVQAAGVLEVGNDQGP